MDPPPKNFLSPKSHILDSNGVWYSSFWSEGPKNHRNLKILVSKFVPRGFEARRTWGFEARRDGVSRRGAGVSRRGAMGFRGAAPSGMGPQGAAQGFRGAAPSGMGPQGAALGFRGTATWDRVIEGIFFIFQCNRF